MPSDIIYGADVEARIGIMADAVTDPTSWQKFEFISAQLTPTRERINRPILGQARNNVLDPTMPIAGFFKFAMTLTVDADARMLPKILRPCLGSPADQLVSGVNHHVWSSGGLTTQYCAIQFRFLNSTSTKPVRIFRGLTFASLSAQVSGEQVENFDIVIGLRGLARDREADWLTGTANAVPTLSPMSRAQFMVDTVAASNTLQASWLWDRQIAEDAFLSTAPQLSGLRPGGGVHTGSAKFRAESSIFDDKEEGDTAFDAQIYYIGTVAGHAIYLEHMAAEFAAAPLAITGPGLIERDWSWSAYQDANNPATKIQVWNDITSYP